MGMQEQLNQQSEDALKQGGKQITKGIVASIKCAAFGSTEFLKVCQKICREGTDKALHNTISVARLTKMVDGRPGDSISRIDAAMTEEATKSFKKYASKYHIKYSLIKDSATRPPTYSVLFAAKDTAIINECVQKYVKDKFKEQKREKEGRVSIKERMKKAKEKMKHVNKDKERNKDRSERER